MPGSLMRFGRYDDERRMSRPSLVGATAFKVDGWLRANRPPCRSLLLGRILRECRVRSSRMRNWSPLG